MLKLETSSEQCAGLEVTRHTWVPDVVSCQSRCQLLCCCAACQCQCQLLFFSILIRHFGQFSVTHSDFQLLSTDYDSPLHYADFELKSIFLAIIVGTMFVTIVYMKVDQLK